MQQPRVGTDPARRRSAFASLDSRPAEAVDYAADAAEADEQLSAVERRFRPQLQPPRPNMDWPDWAVRTQRVQERLATGLEQLIWGGIGALTGTALAGIPGALPAIRPDYPFVLYQPLGAAVGAVCAIVVMSLMRKQRQPERERLVPPSGWTTSRDAHR